MMTMQTRNEYLKTIKKQYLKATKKEKAELLDEYCRNTGQNRKYIIRKLQARVSLKPKQRKKRKWTYDGWVIAALVRVWEIMDYPCGQRLEPRLPELVDILRVHKELNISDELASKLKQISARTIDRRLDHQKKVLHRKHFSTTRPGTSLKNRIPIRLNDWDTSEVGNIALDLVAHCGGSVAGDYANTISATDIATGWWEGEAVMGKGQERTCRGVDRQRRRSPFKWRGIHPDNDAPFINAHMLRYTEKEELEFSRSRPNKKNDNAYVEQKNWTHVRKMVGYLRYDTDEEISLLNSLYRNELRLYKNFFQPVMKLKEKVRVEGRLHRKYEIAKTPYQRVLELGNLTKIEKGKLRSIYQSLNPAELKRKIDGKLKQLGELYDKKQAKRARAALQAKQLNRISQPISTSATVTF